MGSVPLIPLFNRTSSSARCSFGGESGHSNDLIFESSIRSTLRAGRTFQIAILFEIGPTVGPPSSGTLNAVYDASHGAVEFNPYGEMKLEGKKRYEKGRCARPAVSQRSTRSKICGYSREAETLLKRTSSRFRSRHDTAPAMIRAASIQKLDGSGTELVVEISAEKIKPAGPPRLTPSM
jgi:hypothetical protein